MYMATLGKEGFWKVEEIYQLHLYSANAEPETPLLIYF